MTQDCRRSIYKHIAFGCTALTGVIAVVAIAGWLTNNLFLAAFSNVYIPMAPATAICFLLIASGVSLKNLNNAEAARYVIIALSLTVALFCAIILLQFAAHLSSDVESFFLKKKEFSSGIPLGRMSPFTSSGFLSLAIATFSLSPFVKTSQKVKDLGGIFGAFACLVGIVLLLGSIYGNQTFYGAGIIPVSITSALAFILTGTAIVVTAGPESFPLRLVAGESSDARLLRSFMPILFLSLAINGALDILIVQTTENGGLTIAFSTISFFLIICGLLIMVSRSVSRTIDRVMEAQRQSEARALKQYAELKAVIEAMPAGVSIYHDPACSRLTCNQAWLEIIGMTEEQNKALFTGAPCELPQVEMRRGGVPISFEQLPIRVTCNSGQPVVGDTFEIIRADGSSHHYYGSATPLFDSNSNGVVGGAVSVLLDISELRQAQDRIAKLAAIVEASADAIISKTLEGVIGSWNPGAEKLYGYSAKEAIGRSISFIVPPDHPDDIPMILEKIGRGETIASHDTVRMRKDGTVVDVSLMISPIKDSTGKIIGASSIGRDITERKKYEERIKQYSEELDRSNRELNHFASIVSHDLRAPLRAVSGFAGLLQKRYKEKLGADADQYISQIVEGTERMNCLIDDLIEFARVARGDKKNFAPVNINTIIETVFANLSEEIQESKAVITVEPLPTVSANSTLLIQLFQNLLGNAIKYCNTSPRIHISAERKEREWLFRISDNGIGIDPGQFDRIFEIFQRLHTVDEYAGTGIGLAVCKKIVERLGGRIWVESKHGEGSTFFFTLPVTESIHQPKLE